MGLRLCVTMSDSLLHSSLKTMFQKALSCISLCSTPRRFLGLSSQSTTGWGNLKRRKCNVSQFRSPEVPKEGISRAALPLKATEDSLLALPSFECFSAVLGFVAVHIRSLPLSSPEFSLCASVFLGHRGD